MFDPVSYVLGVATGVTAAIVIEMLYDRWRRRPSDLAELQRHQALPPAPAFEQPAATGTTIRLHTVDVARPLPDHHAIIVVSRRKRPE